MATRKLQEVIVRYSCGCCYTEHWYAVTSRELKRVEAQLCEICKSRGDK